MLLKQIYLFMRYKVNFPTRFKQMHLLICPFLVE
jgi:hypothetical protein